MGFLLPPDKRFVFEMLELCRLQNPDYLPKNIPGVKTTEQILQLDQTKKEVEAVVIQMAGPVPVEQRTLSDFEMNESHF